MEDSSVLGARERAGVAKSWRVREGKEWTRSRAVLVGDRPQRRGSGNWRDELVQRSAAEVILTAAEGRQSLTVRF